MSNGFSGFLHELGTVAPVLGATVVSTYQGLNAPVNQFVRSPGVTIPGVPTQAPISRTDSAAVKGMSTGTIVAIVLGAALLIGLVFLSIGVKRGR